jgi:DNA-binding MarR family transcriptional regulator
LNSRAREINELLVKIYNNIMTYEEVSMQVAEYKDLSITEIHTLKAIGVAGKTSMSDVAKKLGITHGTLTIAINRLVRKGYVLRNRIEQDRRVVVIELSEKGKGAYELHEKFHQDIGRVAVKNLDEEGETLLIRALGKLDRFFSRMITKQRIKELRNDER